MSDQMEWQVEKVLQRGTRNGETIYLIQWKGFPKSEATWEPAKNLEHCRKCIQEFQNTLKQCFSGQKKGKKRRKSKKMNLQALQNQDLSEKVRMKDIKNQENSWQAKKIQEETNLPISEKKTTQKQTQKIIAEMVDKQSDVETLEIFSPFFVAPQTQIKEIIGQTSVKVTKRKAKVKRIFSRPNDDSEGLPSKKVKFQINANRSEDECLVDKKDLEQQQKEKQQMIFKKPEQQAEHGHKTQKLEIQEQQEIQLNDYNLQQKKSFKAPQKSAKNQKSQQENMNTVQPNSLPINKENIQPQMIGFKIDGKVTLTEFFHQRQIRCDSLLKSQANFFLNSCLVQTTNILNKNPPLMDITHFPDLLDEYNILKPIKQPLVNMTDFKVLIRIKCGWLVVGKVQEVNSIAEVSYLSASAWRNLLQKYK